LIIAKTPIVIVRHEAEGKGATSLKLSQAGLPDAQEHVLTHGTEPAVVVAIDDLGVPQHTEVMGNDDDAPRPAVLVGASTGL
jgi:hypothetical protein